MFPNPEAARPSASSQLAGRSWPLSRTRGDVKRRSGVLVRPRIPVTRVWLIWPIVDLGLAIFGVVHMVEPVHNADIGAYSTAIDGRFVME